MGKVWRSANKSLKSLAAASDYCLWGIKRARNYCLLRVMGCDNSSWIFFKLQKFLIAVKVHSYIDFEKNIYINHSYLVLYIFHRNRVIIFFFFIFFFFFFFFI